MKVLVTNANSRMALCVARNLKRNGHEVVVADYIKHSMCFFSNKKAEHFVYPSPYSQPEEFVANILEKIKKLHIDVLFPIFEETFLFAKKRDLFLQHVSLAVPNYRSFLTVHNKDRLHKLLIDNSVRTPKTHSLQDFENLNSVRNAFPDRVVLKPRQGGGNWGIRVLNPRQEYEAQIVTYLRETQIDIARVLVQEWIPTQEKFSHVVVYQEGRLVQDFADLHIRDYPLGGGAGVVRMSCDSSPMTSISRKIFDTLHWHGIAEVEYVTHAKTGEYYLIEINPRIWGGVNSAISSGLGIVGMLVDIATNVDVRCQKYEFGKRTRWFWGDMRTLPEYVRSSQKRHLALGEYLKMFFDDTKTDEFYWDDPLPFFVWPCHTIFKVIRNRSLNSTPYDSLSGEWE